MRTDNQKLEVMLRELLPKVEGGHGRWRAVHDQAEILVLSDESHDRMRLMTVVTAATSLRAQDLIVLMSANFDRALDARYALWKGELWSVYLHPLGSLSRPELESALRQVIALKKSYGTTYTSTDLTFGPAGN